MGSDGVKAIKTVYCSNAAGKKRRAYFYGTTAWRKFRAIYISKHPLCEHCLKDGKLTAATLVDHVIEIMDGGARLSESNVQSLCDACHNRKTALKKKERAAGVQEAPEAPDASPWGDK